MWECSSPPPLTDDQLSAALDSTADQAIYEHLTICQACSARLEQARQFERAIVSRLQRWDCPSPQRLGEYHLGLASAEEAGLLRQHVQQCVRCTEEVHVLQSFLGTESLVQVQQRQPRTRPLRLRLGEVLATLLPQTPALAMRGQAQQPVVAVADTTTVVLEAQSAAQGMVAVVGQVTDDADADWSEALVELRQADTLIAITQVDAIGGFVAGPFPAGPTTVRITTPTGRSIVLPEVELRIEN